MKLQEALLVYVQYTHLLGKIGHMLSNASGPWHWATSTISLDIALHSAALPVKHTAPPPL